MEVPNMFLNRILSEVAKNKASSLHLAAGSPPAQRVEGELFPLDGEEILTSDLLIKVLEELLSGEEKEKLEKEKQIYLVKIFPGNLRFRINIYYQKGLPSISFNYISGHIRNWQEYNFPNQVSSLTKKDNGLFIIGGPNDSGRTSMAASFLEEINKNQKKYIITLENPIENLFVNKKSIIDQRQVGSDARDYKAGLEHSLKEDVDGVYISELGRGFEEIAPLILELASGNCLVILEMNADNSIRILEYFLSGNPGQFFRYHLADALQAICCLRLFPKRGGGMAMASEILINNPPIKALIRNNEIYKIENVLQNSRSEGMISMEKAIENLQRGGDIKTGF